MLRLFLSIGMLAALTACSSTAKVPGKSKVMNEEITSLDGDPILIGPSNLEGLMKEPFRTWFVQEFQSYKLDKFSIDPVKNDLKEVNLLVFMGTWCSDSQREIPRFYKILDYIGFNQKHLELVCVDNHPDRYKQSPGGETKTWNITNVPTFIVLKDGKELGRIVEYPETTLERDLAKILGK